MNRRQNEIETGWRATTALLACDPFRPWRHQRCRTVPDEVGFNGGNCPAARRSRQSLPRRFFRHRWTKKRHGRSGDESQPIQPDSRYGREDGSREHPVTATAMSGREELRVQIHACSPSLNDEVGPQAKAEDREHIRFLRAFDPHEHPVASLFQRFRNAVS